MEIDGEFHVASSIFYPPVYRPPSPTMIKRSPRNSKFTSTNDSSLPRLPIYAQLLAPATGLVDANHIDTKGAYRIAGNRYRKRVVHALVQWIVLGSDQDFGREWKDGIGEGNGEVGFNGRGGKHRNLSELDQIKRSSVGAYANTGHVVDKARDVSHVLAAADTRHAAI